MATKATIILDKRSKSTQGHPLKIYVRNNGKRYLPLNSHYSFPEHWHGDGPNKKHPNHKKLSEFIIKRRAKLIDEVNHCNAHGLDLLQSVEVIKNGLESKEVRITRLKEELAMLQDETPTMLFEFWNEYSQERSDKGLSTKAFDLTKSQLANYLLDQDVAINDITFEFLNDFSRHKLAGGCNQGGLNHYLATFRTVYKEAQKRESLNIKSTNPFLGLIKPSNTKEPVEMTVDEMADFVNFKPHESTTKKNSKKLRQRHAIHYFQFLIGGHDLIDVALLEWKKNVRNGRIRFRRHKNRRHKNGGPLIDNLLMPRAMQIINDHGTPKNARVFGFIPHPKDENSYRNYIGNTRRSLRKISEQLELNDILKTKSMRYIFKTWADEMQLHDRSIKQIQGHIEPSVSARYGARLPNSQVDEILEQVVNRENKKNQ